MSSFFLVSTEMTGSPLACAATTFVLMCSNCALRSGWCAPSSALRFTCREKPSTSVSSLPTVFALILCPISLSARASFSRLFDTHRNGCTGEPSVAGSTKRLRSSTSVGSVALSALPPPPLRRTRPPGRGPSSRSSSPRLMVERARPVMRETTLRAPWPAACTSPAAHSRLPRSSSLEPIRSHRSLMPVSSISSLMPTRYACSRRPGIPPSQSVTPTERDSLAAAGVLILAPHAHEVGGALGEDIGLRGLALALEQAAPCRLQVEQQLALGSIAQVAAHPAGGGQPLSARDGRDAVQRGRGICDKTSRLQLEGFLARRCVHDELSAVVGRRIRQE